MTQGAVLETAKALKPGTFGVRGSYSAEAASHSTGLEADRADPRDGFFAHGGQVALRYGIVQDVEIQAEGQLFHVEDLRFDESPFHVGMRVGGKYSIEESFALTAGFGFNTSAALGNRFGGDLGVLLSAENDVFVPFLNSRFLFFFPTHEKKVDIRNTEPDPPKFEQDTSGYALGVTCGFKVPLYSNPTQTSSLQVSLVAAFDTVFMFESSSQNRSPRDNPHENSYSSIGGAAGIDVTF